VTLFSAAGPFNWSPARANRQVYPRMFGLALMGRECQKSLDFTRLGHIIIRSVGTLRPRVPTGVVVTNRVEVTQ